MHSNAARSVLLTRACGCAPVGNESDVNVRHNSKMHSLVGRTCRWEERRPICQPRRKGQFPPTLRSTPRCRKSSPTVSLSRCVPSIVRCKQPIRFPSHPCALSHPRARATVTSTAQIVLAAMHADSGRRQGHTSGAHYPNASAARHRLLFAASRPQERRRGVKQAGNRWRQNFGAGRSDRWLAAVSETIHVG